MRDGISLWARSQQVLELLNSRQSISRSQMADSLCLSQRQVSRIIGSLIHAGYAIHTSKQGYRLETSTTVTPLELSPAESIVLLMISNLSTTALEPEPRKIWEAIAKKIRKRLSATSQRKLDQLEDHIPLVSSEARNSRTQGFEAIEESLSKQLQLRIEYLGTNDSEPRWRQVEPLCLFLGSGRWYLEAFDLGSQAQKTFRLSRISQAAVVAIAIRNHREVPEEPAGFHRWSLLDGPTYEVSIELQPPLNRWFGENPIHPQQRILDGKLVFPAKDLSRVADWLISLRGARALGPAELLACLRARILELQESLGDIPCPSSA